VSLISELFVSSCENPRLLSPLVLAFVGDAIYGLLVRERLVLIANTSVGKLHRNSVRYVSAKAQASAVEKIEALLDEEEERIYKRGRNATVNSVPKNADVADYHKATGLEALFGYLYLSNRHERIKHLFDVIWDTIEID